MSWEALGGIERAMMLVMNVGKDVEDGLGRN